MSQDQIDDALSSTLEGGVPHLFDVLFSFLSRKTDFFTATPIETSRKMVFDAMNKYAAVAEEEPAEERRAEERRVADKENEGTESTLTKSGRERQTLSQKSPPKVRQAGLKRKSPSPPAAQPPPKVSNTAVVTTASTSTLVPVLRDIKTFEVVRMREYFDCCCQVIGVFSLGDGVSVLRVWDGTRPNASIAKCGSANAIVMHTELETEVDEYVADIFCYDDYAQQAALCEPFDNVALVNVHAYVDKNMTQKFTLHGGGKAYKRGIYVLQENGTRAKRLIEQLKCANADAVQLATAAQESSVNVEEPMDFDDGNEAISSKDDGKVQENRALADLLNNCDTLRSTQ